MSYSSEGDKWIQTCRRFFALSNELGYNSNKIKEHAKRFWGEFESFRNLSTVQLKLLIEKMEERINGKSTTIRG
jgi:hypothetical protein